jgi:hypothetical protein
VADKPPGAQATEQAHWRLVRKILFKILRKIIIKMTGSKTPGLSKSLIIRPPLGVEEFGLGVYFPFYVSNLIRGHQVPTGHALPKAVDLAPGAILHVSMGPACSLPIPSRTSRAYPGSDGAERGCGDFFLHRVASSCATGWWHASQVADGGALRDLAAESQIETVLVHAPDRLSRKYAYQVLLLSFIRT